MNQRIIKFRAWRKDTKQMYDDIQFADFQEEKIVHNQSLNEAIEIAQKTFFELMQFTGLKDKNGKDIYEGDIVGYWGNKTDGYITWRVLWNKHRGSWRFGDDVTDYSVVELKKKEVIGNIFEHPKLLQ